MAPFTTLELFPKRKALAEFNPNAARPAPKRLAQPGPRPEPTATDPHPPAKFATPPPPTKPTRKINVGGGSKMRWLNQLIDCPKLQPALQNLAAKITDTETTPSGCVQVVGKDEHFRPQIDKRLREQARELCPDLPERFAVYHISLACSGKHIPTSEPPAYPAELRKVKAKRSAAANAGNEKDACWVASHLCHNRQCIASGHLEWEPSWMNRLRDNCPGGTGCIHRPRPCIAPHRSAEELVDWTQYWSLES